MTFINRFPSMFRRVFSALSAAAFLSCMIPGSAAADVTAGVVVSIKPVHSLVSAVMEGTGEPHLNYAGHRVAAYFQPATL